ncbi:MAG: ATP-dependent Clp protease adapter ClpS [Campylobacterota bacterium]
MAFEYEEKIDTKLQLPKKYEVLLHNDDYTTMDFVIEILIEFFHKSEHEAYNIMLKIHKEGLAVCGIYTKEIAQTKVEQVKAAAKQSGFPLLATMRKCDD